MVSVYEQGAPDERWIWGGLKAPMYLASTVRTYNIDYEDQEADNVLHYLVVCLNKVTPMYYNPYYGDLLNGTLVLGHPI